MKRSYLVGLFLMMTLNVQGSEGFTTSQVMLKAETEASLSSQIIGTIDSIPVKEGELFDKGDVLVEFDCTIHQAQLDKALALLESKRAAYNSNVKMSKAKAVSTVELLQSKADFTEAKADVTIKQHTVDFCKVKAPFNGQVIKLHAKAFELLNQGEPLVDVLDNSELDVELIVPSKWLSWLKKDTPFNLYITETNKSYNAHVTKILPSVDSVSQTVRILGKLDKNHVELVAGMSGKASFLSQTNNIK